MSTTMLPLDPDERAHLGQTLTPRQLAELIAARSAQLPKVDANGRVIIEGGAR